MLVHSASQQSRAGTSRYVLFTTFFDMSASYALLPVRGASLHPRKFTPDFRQALGPELAYLLCLLLSLLAVKLCVVYIKVDARCIVRIRMSMRKCGCADMSVGKTGTYWTGTTQRTKARTAPATGEWPRIDTREAPKLAAAAPNCDGIARK